MKTTTNNINRRTLLRSSLYAGTALALPTWSRAAGANGDIRVAVIGFKSRGAGHINTILGLQNEGVRLVALCDVDSDVMDKQVEKLAKKDIKVKTYSDYRKLIEDPEIDAVTIATPNHTHTVITLAALAAGKHVFAEKPVCHNIPEGVKLLEAAKKIEGKLILVHGQQRRSDLGWAAAMEYVKSGALGKTTLSRGVNYKARKSIGKVSGPQDAPSTVNYDLWAGPRETTPIMREQFHYDWHWQWAYGNGDIGNQGPHQLDVARWALGSPDKLPLKVMSLGNRWGYDDDGETANNQLAFYDYGDGKTPILFDNRGLPRADMNWQKGFEPAYKGIRIGNIIHCEGGYVAESKAYDAEGKFNDQKFEIRDGPNHMKNFFASIKEGKLIDPNLHVSHGFHCAALAHMANIAYRIGKKTSTGEIKERLQGDKAGQETFDDFVANLAANQINADTDQALLSPWLTFNPDTYKFEGEFAEEANKINEGDVYRKGFELAEV
ncbi:Gfo/Idh/MocA family oxidoreductase [Phragmitibacter flavus]|uniref:Gfo/Idh/MocA family oxidoreductase n=1 Tax=Phragmitibacter flavus TaxID=2576071 RepID=A0A5R8K8G3_9BACT|nr:Gfo/Idh/MocA family oxidoreductase [Phragmitibacter flavus]TLD68603.1 Gfo/Idh/MocA family oxidoreductase [Phragmitibacter flavus]